MIPAIIPYYKDRPALDRCLASLERQGVEFAPLIRDNSEDNIYYTGAVNEKLLKVLHDWPVFPHYALVICQDVELQDDCLKNLIEIADAKPQAGIVCPIQLSDKTPTGMFWAGAGACYPNGQVLQMAESELPKDPYPLFWANGGVMLLRIEMIRDIGILDKNMRFVFSDGDYSFRARAAGWEILMNPKAKAKHDPGTSAKGITDPELQKVCLEDRDYFRMKWVDGDLYKKLAFEHQMIGAEL